MWAAQVEIWGTAAAGGRGGEGAPGQGPFWGGREGEGGRERLGEEEQTGCQPEQDWLSLSVQVGSRRT